MNEFSLAYRLRLQSHISSFPTFSTFQLSYRRFHSTETALLIVQNDLIQAKDSKKLTALVLLDLHAAFDHSILTPSASVMVWYLFYRSKFFLSELSDRTKCAHIKEHSSNSVITQTVLQGSVSFNLLGPLLFTL